MRLIPIGAVIFLGILVISGEPQAFEDEILGGLIGGSTKCLDYKPCFPDCDALAGLGCQGCESYPTGQKCTCVSDGNSTNTCNAMGGGSWNCGKLTVCTGEQRDDEDKCIGCLSCVAHSSLLCGSGINCSGT